MGDLNNKEPDRPLTPRMTSRGPFIGFTLKTSTWVSNSHGLYDYESHHVSAKTYRCHGRNNSYRVLRKGVDVTLVPDAVGCGIIEADPEVQTIARLIALEEGGYALQPVQVDEDLHLRRAHCKATGRYAPPQPLTESESARLAEDLRFWIVVRSVKEGSLPLQEGDVVKLGRLAFRVRQIVLNNEDERTVMSHLCSAAAAAAAAEDDDVATCETRRSAERQRCGQPQMNVGGGGGSSCDQNVLLSQSLPNSRNRVSSAGSGFDSHVTDWPPAGGCLSSSEEDSSSVNGTADHNSHQCQCPPSNGGGSSGALVMNREGSDYGVPLCRVCLCEEEDSQRDPLVSPCKCAGSMRWIHLQCLRRWMEGRLNIKSDEGGNTCFFWRPLECELCQQPYPTYIDLSSSAGKEKAVKEDPVSRALRANAAATNNNNTDSNLVELFEIPKPAIPFLILESKHQPSGLLGFHFVSFEKKGSIQLGRGHEADIRVPDISVSRLHASLQYQADPESLSSILRSCEMPTEPFVGDEKVLTPLGAVASLSDVHRPYVYIEDLKSKFGTLVAVRQPVLIFPRMMISIQVGRTVLTLYVRKPTWSRLLPSCLHIYYRGLMPRRLRRRRQSASDATRLEPDTHDVRLVETFVPLGILNGDTTPTNGGDLTMRNQRIEGEEEHPAALAQTHAAAAHR